MLRLLGAKVIVNLTDLPGSSPGTGDQREAGQQAPPPLHGPWRKMGWGLGKGGHGALLPALLCQWPRQHPQGPHTCPLPCQLSNLEPEE